MSDHENSDEENAEKSVGFSLSSILFGNVNKDGELIDDFFGKETSEHLKKLDQFNIASGLIEELKEDVKESIRNANDLEGKSEESKDDDKKFDKKDADAIDYSDINEMVDDIQPEDDTKFREALSELVFKMPTAPISKPTIQQQKKLDLEDKNYDSTDNDKSKLSSELNKKHQKDNFSQISSVTKQNKNETSEKNDGIKRLDTPLAEMLPTKYENCDVTQLFPEFRPNKTLRFSRLFGNGKSSLMPNPWRNVKNKKRKRKRPTSESTKEENKDDKETTLNNETITTTVSTVNKAKKEFELKFADTYDENNLEEDEEEFLKRPLENKDYLNTNEDLNGDLAKKIAHWKNGPAAFWYSNMFAPEASKIFDLVFKKQIRDQDDESSEEIYEE